MSAGAELVAAAVAALRDVAELAGVFEGAPLQAPLPHEIVDAGAESDGGHKSGVGREVRIAVTIRDEGERPVRPRRVMAGVEAALANAPALPGWQIVTMRFLSSRTARDRQSGWTGLVEFRARMLAP